MNIAPARPAPKKLTVLVDTREQTPITFPANLTWSRFHPPIPITCKRSTLSAGDYTIEEHPSFFGVERKGSADELSHNLSPGDWKRQCSALSRLCASYLHPYLLIESGPLELLKCPHNPALPMLLGQLSSTHPILRVIPVGRQRAVGRRISLGEFILQFFLGHLLVGDLTNAESVV